MARNRQKGPKSPTQTPKIGQNARVGGVAFAESTPSRGSDNPLMGEFAVKEFWKALSAISYLPNPDPILRSEGRSIALYRQMTDGHLLAVVGKRRAAVRARPWSIEIDGASARPAKRITEILKKLPIRSLTNSVLDAVFYGYSVAEVIWEVRDGWIVPSQIKPKPQEWFGWNADGTLRFVSDSGLGEPVPERKFLVAQHEPEFLNPYGLPLYSCVFWPLSFKRGGLKWWMTFLEKYGMPYAVGKMPASASEEDRLDMLSQLSSMARDAAAVIPDNASVELLEAGGKSGSTNSYAALVQWADTEISKAILGETLSTELGTNGSLAAAQVHNEVRRDLALDDASMVEAVYNQLIDWIYELNAPGESVRPRFQIQMPEDLQMGRLARDKGLRSMGVGFSSEYYADTYHIDPKYILSVGNPSPGGLEDGKQAQAFAESQVDPDASWRPDTLSQDLALQLAPDDIQSHQQEIAGTVLAMAGRSSGFAEFMDLLQTQYPGMPMPDFEAAVTKFALLGDLAGQTDGGNKVRTALERQ